MLGLMQEFPLLVHRVLDHAARWHGTTEIVSRSVEGPIHCTTYAQLDRRARSLASAAQQRLRVKLGTVVGTMAWNTWRHLEIWYAIMGAGAIVHTLNPRLFADQLEYIVNHAEDEWIFIDLSFVSLFEKLQDRLPDVKGFVIMTDADHMPVGSTVGLLMDDTIVLRVRGDTSELLRGEVYDAYVERGGWTSTLGDTTDVDARTTGGRTASVTGEEADRFFVPHTHACVATATGRARVSSGGVFRPAMGESGRRVTTSADCDGRGVSAAAPPGPADLDVPKPMARLLDATLDRWQVRANFGVRAQLTRIERGLADEHPYALDVPRDDRIDPVVDFLTKHPAGHCELFASTAALLARRAGIPARVVAGYRVVEKSRFGDWYVVRKSHAHAWIETWDGTRWVSLDPTPAREEPARGKRSLLASLRDLAGAAAKSALCT